MQLQDKELYKQVSEERENGSMLGMISLVSMLLLLITVVMLSCK